MRTFVESVSRVILCRPAGKNGQTLVEYALVLAVLTIVLVLVFSLLSAKIVVVFSAIANLLDTAQGSH
jgi:Flp pilus assembly pilin Flp